MRQLIILTILLLFSASFFGAYAKISSPERGILHLHDCVIDKSVTYHATDVILGKNVVVKSGATLTLIVENGYEMLDNVVCEDGAKLVLKHK